MVVDEFGHYCYSHCAWAGREYLTNFFILFESESVLLNDINQLCLSSYLETNNVLSVDFCDVMIDQYTVTSCRTVFDDLSDFAISESEPNMIGAILLHCNGPLKRSEGEKDEMEFQKRHSTVILPVPQGECNTI